MDGKFRFNKHKFPHIEAFKASKRNKKIIEQEVQKRILEIIQSKYLDTSTVNLQQNASIGSQDYSFNAPDEDLYINDARDNSNQQVEDNSSASYQENDIFRIILEDEGLIVPSVPIFSLNFLPKY
jgi:hypothetical protein